MRHSISRSGAAAICRRADGSPMAKVSGLARPNGRAAKIAGMAEHLDLVAHRIPESDVERALLPFGLHRLIDEPAKPFAHADRRNTRHYGLVGIGRRDLLQGFALGHGLHPLNIHRQA